MTKREPPISKQQQLLLIFVRDFLQERRFAPRLKDCVIACDYSSHGTLLKAIVALKKRGLLDINKYGWRSVRLTDAGLAACKTRNTRNESDYHETARNRRKR